MESRLNRLEAFTGLQRERWIVCECGMVASQDERDQFVREAVPDRSERDLVIWLHRLTDGPLRLVSITNVKR
jgi:hypothetical protein